MITAMQVDLKEVTAETTAYEYDVLVDVLANILLGPFPDVALMACHRPATAADRELAVESLRGALPPSLREVRGLQQHLFALTRCALTQHHGSCLLV
jgi:hypothetical protein